MKPAISRPLLKASFAACALFGLTAPALAVVQYDFAAGDTGGHSYELSFTADTFLETPTHDLSINILDIAGASCSVSGGPCQRADIDFQTESYGSQNIFTISVGTATAGGQFVFVYRNPGINVFGQVGTYLADCTCDGGRGTLDVSVSAVPEPATWAMFAVGTGLVGWSVRRRKDHGSLSAA